MKAGYLSRAADDDEGDVWSGGDEDDDERRGEKEMEAKKNCGEGEGEQEQLAGTGCSGGPCPTTVPDATKQIGKQRIAPITSFFNLITLLLSPTDIPQLIPHPRPTASSHPIAFRSIFLHNERDVVHPHP